MFKTHNKQPASHHNNIDKLPVMLCVYREMLLVETLTLDKVSEREREREVGWVYGRRAIGVTLKQKLCSSQSFSPSILSGIDSWPKFKVYFPALSVL